MTKEQFRHAVEEATNELCSMPDDLWEGTFPYLRLVYPDCVIVVGLEERIPTDDDR